jgi:Cu+-exporting ATPase
MAQDPVCGMQISEREAVGSFEYQGTVYHFCSQFCRAAFIYEPEKYSPTKKDAEPKHHPSRKT